MDGTMFAVGTDEQRADRTNRSRPKVQVFSQISGILMNNAYGESSKGRIYDNGNVAHDKTARLIRQFDAALKACFFLQYGSPSVPVHMERFSQG